MNVFDLGDLYVPFEADGSTPPFQVGGFVTIEIPSEHGETTQTLGGGSLSLEFSTDEGENWRIYTDLKDDTPATLSVLDRLLGVDIAGTIMARATLANSTDPDLKCVRVNSEQGLKAL